MYTVKISVDCWFLAERFFLGKFEFLIRLGGISKCVPELNT
jgi:hypothetical protein